MALCLPLTREVSPAGGVAPSGPVNPLTGLPSSERGPGVLLAWSEEGELPWPLLAEPAVHSWQALS